MEKNKDTRTTMKKIPLMIKKICATLIIGLFAMILSTESYAQGPTAPEAASFEPVDATDMVNLVTGDLSYVLPLLNIPSPEGGYPLALSYHAGVAVDQEATWTGLGWNLNPGAINRGVNGYPDDWGKTGMEEFFYDEGFTQNFYSFSIGYAFSDATSIGLGVSWGSNQSLSGSVSLGLGAVSIQADSGGLGFGISGGSASGINFTISTRGVGVGYGIANKQGNSVVGMNLNYNYANGLSGGFSVAKKAKEKSYSLGVSFSSGGVSINGKINGVGAGVSNSSSSISAGDYDVGVSTSGFSLPLYSFNISYSHTKVKFSLFKGRENFVSGMLYPMLANQTYEYTNGEQSVIMDENHFMDVETHLEYDESQLTTNNLVDYYESVYGSSLVVPNYDNFVVNSQGLSGSMSIYNPTELNLSGRAGKTPVPWAPESNWETYYFNHDISDFDPAANVSGVNLEAVNKKYFTFTDVYNSFLRYDTSNIYDNSGTSNYTIDKDILAEFTADETSTYNNTNSLTSANVKREGNVIESFTNQEIRGGTILNFVDAKEGSGFLNRQDMSVFLDEGVGAFRITSMDGKVYHYSLPVYQFESYYRSFKDETDEDKNFFTLEKKKPYASHWLLTGITGPDYFDKNGNGILDEGDYGYWISFDYGKWSDGHAWQNPNHKDYEEIEDNEDPNDKTFSYTWGRKQVYYLDAIKTRSHTALFIKEKRLDGQSKLREDFDQKAPYNSSTGEFDILSGVHSKHHIDQNYSNVLLGPWTMYDSYGNTVNLAVGAYQAKRTRSYYTDIPKGKSLSLKKILLFKNDMLPVVSKENLSQQAPKVGVICDYRLGFKDIFNVNGQQINPNNMYFDQLSQHTFEIDIEKNVYDVQDISGMNLEASASQVIDFVYDYSLAIGARNTTSGKLALKGVYFKGKSGVSVLPPYEFGYHHPEMTYSLNDMDDWGYHSSIPYIWSLAEITTPTGGRIQIDYESDSYYAESAMNLEEHVPHTAYSSFAGRFVFSSSIDINKYFKVGDYYKTSVINSSNEKIEQIVKVTNINGSELFIEDPVSSLGTDFKIYGQHYDYTEILNNSNGKEEGGLRVKTVSVSGDNGLVNTTEYDYSDPVTGKTTGITSYSPTKEARKIPYVSLLPGPSVMYSNVKVTSKGKYGAVLGHTNYEFQTLEPRKQESGYIYSLGDAFKIEKLQDDYFTFRHSIKETGATSAIYNGGRMKKYKIHNNLGILGRPKSIETYNSVGNVMHSSRNNYKSDLNADQEIGVTQESHKSVKKVYGTQRLFLMHTSKVNYPSVLESVTDIEGGLRKTTYFTEHDFLTGRVLETKSYSGDGKAFISRTIPAYEKYTGMGSKIDNSGYKNMLTQDAAQYSYFTQSGSTNEQVVNATISTWNNNWTYRDYKGIESTPTSNDEKVWRKHKVYFWNGDVDSQGVYVGFNYNTDDGFNWGVGANQTNPKWQAMSEITRYDRFSGPVESKDINNNYLAVRKGDKDSKIIATAEASLLDTYYSGAEYVVENDISYMSSEIKSLGRTQSSTAHTGDYIVSVSSGQKGFETNVPSSSERTGVKQKFLVSVWVRSFQRNNARIKLNGQNISFNTAETQLAGDWALLRGEITIPTSGANVAVTCVAGTIDFDDFRLYPAYTTMTSFVYNQDDELSHIIGEHGLSLRYEYDEGGRLIKVYREVVDEGSSTGGFKLTNDYGYNYKSLSTTGPTPVVFTVASIDQLNPNVPFQVGKTLFFEAKPEGGSGNYSYSWVFKKGSTTLKTGAGRYSSISFSPSDAGSNSLEYTVTDNATGQVKSKTRNYFVSSGSAQTMSFANILENSVGSGIIVSSATATVPVSETVRFSALSFSTQGTVQVTIKRGSTVLYTGTLSYYNIQNIDIVASAGDVLTCTLTGSGNFTSAQLEIANSVNGAVVPGNPKVLSLTNPN